LFKEYEVKVVVRDVDKISKMIKENSLLLKKIVQFDTYYDRKKTLFLKDEHLRLRVEYDQDSRQVKHVELTWKGPRHGKDIEIREDISIQILPDDLKNLERILKRLGFEPLAVIKKIRERYRVNNIELEFDKNVELIKTKDKSVFLGSFLQASVETSIEQDPRNIKNKLWRYLGKLGFKYSDWIGKSYIELALEKLES